MKINCTGHFGAICIGILLSIGSAKAVSTNQLPKFDDLLKLVREHGALTPSELDRAATQGLLTSLRGQIVLVTNDAPKINDQTALVRSTNYDNGYAYFRFGQVKGDLASSVKKEFQQMSTGNRVKGVVIDVRFADGMDYSAAGKVADLFVNSTQPLLSWGHENITATTKQDAINVPVVVLVNRDTTGAAEALAAVLRETQAALLIGSATAGSASVFNDFTLPDGQRVKLAVSQIKIAGDKTISPEGLKPDIQVDVQPEDERSYLDDPYRSTAKTPVDSTNSVATAVTKTNTPRLNEAELVRQHREGINMRDEVADAPLKDVPTTTKTINDPALMRALDLLKGLSVVQQTRH